MDLNECIIIGKDLIIALAAISTAYVAIKGINRWKTELEGKAHFEVARDLMKAVYRFRDQMSDSRSPFITTDEFPKDYNPLTNDAKEKGDAYVYVYQNRIKPLTEVAREFDFIRLEAEVLWGESISEKCKTLRGTYFKLTRSIQFYIDDVYSDGENMGKEFALKKDIRDDMNESYKEDDQLSVKIKDIIKDIEKDIRPYLDKTYDKRR